MMGTFLVVQWLSLHAPNAGGLSSTPGLGNGSHMPHLENYHSTTKDPAPTTKTQDSQTNNFSKEKINK